MNPYLFTVVFLLLMGFLTSSEVIRFSQNNLEHHWFISSRETFVSAENQKQLAHLEELRGDTPICDPKPKIKSKKTEEERCQAREKKIAPLRVNRLRPPNNSRLNIYKFLLEESKALHPSSLCSLYEALAQLMRDLYQTQNQMEYQILDEILEKKEEALFFTDPEQLSTLTFSHPELQETFYQMLQGTKKSPSLLNFLTYDKIDSRGKQARKINFLFADPQILHAIFPKGEIADKLIAHRELILKEIFYQEESRLKINKEDGKGRETFNKEVKNLLETILQAEGLDADYYISKVFDYGLSEPGTIIFITDSLTGKITREKYSRLNLK